MSTRNIIYLTLLALLLSACVSPAKGNSPPTLAALTIVPEQIPTSETYYQSSGGGEPRSPGYWLIWNTCAEGNRSEMARANGGRDAGWILMDDLLADPGILLGELQVETCQQGVSILQVRDLQDTDMTMDAAYPLAAQLLTAQLNLATGSEYCPASDQAVSQAQLLLLELNFDGLRGYLGPPLTNAHTERAQKLAEQLASYNNGSLCIP